MNLTLSDVRNAIRDAEMTFKAADVYAERLVELLTGPRLRLLSGYELKRLKRELRNFNITTGRWSKK